MVATTELALYGLSPLVILLNISLLTVLETKSLTSKDVIISSKGNHEVWSILMLSFLGI